MKSVKWAPASGRTKIVVLTVFLTLLTDQDRQSLKLLLPVQTEAEILGLAINKEKTKFMTRCSHHNNHSPLVVIVTNRNETNAEIDNRQIMANKCHCRLKNKLKSQLISRKIKINMYSS